MHWFTDFIQPLTDWLHTHPHWALLMTFLVSFSESLAIIGTLIPGSVTMTAIGILAGSGVMRIDLTLLAAILGAIAGDSASYILGFACRDRLQNIWPFNRYPQWIAMGKQYFAKHGGKSVLIGRFAGPLRSVIPVIAGMLHMSQYRFLVANVLSAIGWSLLYIVPGILIGAASHELSPESATRLFAAILVLLAILWLTGILLKHLLLRMTRFLKNNLHAFWDHSRNRTGLSRFIIWLTPVDETNHYPTAALALIALTSLTGVLLLTAAGLSGITHTADSAMFHLFQSLRTPVLDSVFILFRQFGSLLTLSLVFSVTALMLIACSEWRMLKHWFGLFAAAGCIILATALAQTLSKQTGSGYVGFVFPAPGILVESCLLCSLALAAKAWCYPTEGRVVALFPVIILFISALARIWQGSTGLTAAVDSMLAGLFLATGTALLLRRKQAPPTNGRTLIFLLMITLMIAATQSALLHFREDWKRYSPSWAQYVLSREAWWNQTKPLLPLYRTNRFGHRISLFNLQFAGSVKHLRDALQQHGWQTRDESFVYTLARHMDGEMVFRSMPLLSQLYHNRKPVLVMTFDPPDGSAELVLRFWRSNYHLLGATQPVWIGSVHPFVFTTTAGTASRHPVSTLIPSLSMFSVRTLQLSPVYLKSLPTPMAPEILLVMENNTQQHTGLVIGKNDRI